MHKIRAVIRREFVERVRTRWFWIGTIFGPFFFFGLILLQAALGVRRGGERIIVVVDGTTTGIGPVLASELSAAIPRFHVTTVPRRAGTVDSLREEVIWNWLDGFLLISDSTLDLGTAEYRGSNASAIGDMEELERALNRLIFAARLERSGIDPVLVRRAEIPVRLATQTITGAKATGESGAQVLTLAFGMAVIVFMAILLYGVNVMSSVLEEKTTRVVEVLISSLRPFELMLGKVLGAGAVGMLQLSVWAVSALVLTGQQRRFTAVVGAGERSDIGFQLPLVATSTVLVFLTFFLLGYFLYSAIFAAVGAMSSSESEARQTQAPVSLVLMVPYLSFFGILNDPHGRLAVWMSLIPFWSPIAVPVRWAAAPIPVVELAGSIAILAAAVLGVTWAAARIYRVGILMTGKRPNLRELVRWVRAA